VSKIERLAIKISRDAHEQLRDLVAFAARNGWSALDVDRDDPPTNTAILEEAIRLFATRMTKPARSKR